MPGQTPQIVLITGASTGIGFDCAGFLTKKGFKVYGTSRALSKIPTGSVSFHPIEMDVTNSNSVQRAVDSILEKEGRIDVVVNNAGYALMGPVEETSTEQMTKAFETNVMGPHRVIQAVLPTMRRQRSGKIICISSIAGFFGLPFRGVYSATKAALENMMESLQYEVDPFGIRICLIAPGDVKTEINQHRERAALLNGNSPYEHPFAKAARHINDTVTNGMPPRTISNRVYQLIKADNPPFRSVIGTPVQRWSITANNLLPNTWFRRIIKSYMDLS